MTVLEKAGSGSIEPEDFNRVVDELNSAGPPGTVTAADVDSQAAQDGDVLTADGAGGAAWAALSVKSVDLGVISAVALSTGGPQVLYTPSAGEYIDLASLRFRDFTAFVTSPNDNGAVQFATPTLLALAATAQGLISPMFDTDTCFDGGDFAKGGPGYVAGNTLVTTNNVNINPLDSDPLTAYYMGGGDGIVVDSVPSGWQANHVYTGGEWIIVTDPENGGDWLWQASAGTSGNSLPDFDNSTSPVSDGTMDWTVHGDVATDGALHAYVNVWTPA